MKTIREIYRIGYGPSSSHTMGPRKASEIFLNRHPEAVAFEVSLYGSLAATGKGHLTDVAILDTLQPHAPVEIVWKPSVFLSFHPNGMTFRSKNSSGEVTDEWTVFSVGGGALAEEGKPFDKTPELYEMNSMTQILSWCERTGRSYWEYVQECEDHDIWDYLAEVWSTMREAIERGLDQEGVLPGPLNLRRKASSYYIKAKGYKDSLKSRGLVFAYALAVSEENAAGGRVVTAPTNGAAGVIPAVINYYRQFIPQANKEGIRTFLLVAGAIGALYKKNASISGAEVGCQGEVGVACSMAAAGLAAALGATNEQIENAAEIGMEHHLGLTCDPVRGQVQIPCIERNGIAAVKAVNSVRLAMMGDGSHYVSLDQVIETMMQTGKDMANKYKETSLGGLAVCVVEC